MYLSFWELVCALIKNQYLYLSIFNDQKTGNGMNQGNKAINGALLLSLFSSEGTIIAINVSQDYAGLVQHEYSVLIDGKEGIKT